MGLVVVYERDGYTLYARQQLVRGERYQTIYFFSKRKPVVGEVTDVPDGYLVVMEKKSGIPYLRKR